MDEFSDDGFEDIDAGVLQELENNAIQFTQVQAAQKAASSRPADAHPPSPYDLTFEDDDLDDAVVIDERAQVPAVSAIGREKSLGPPQQPSAVTGASRHQGWSHHAALSAAPRTAAPLPSQPYAPRHLPPSQRAYASGRPVPSQAQFIRPPPPPITQRYSGRPSEGPQHSGVGGQGDVITALQTRIHALETELTSAKGEIAIVRSQYDKATANHDVEIARLKKQNSEQLAKQERAVEAAIAAERTAATELEFTRQDLKEELGKAKSKRKDGPATPKKNKNWGMADGFDDIELMASPSKGRTEKGKAVGPIALPLNDRTPTKGKRKRPVFESPVYALETHSDDVAMLEEGADRSLDSQSAALVQTHSSLPFDFLRVVLDHGSMRDQPPTFDVLSRFSFPSDPSQTFASIIFHKLPLLGSPQDPRRLLVDFCLMIIDMWTRCLQEKYHSPIYYLVSLVGFTLQLNTMDVAPQIVAYLVPAVQSTCHPLARQRFSSVDGDVSHHPDPQVQQLNADVDITSTLGVLYLVSLGCASSIPSTSPDSENTVVSSQMEFWKLMEMEFVIVMLSAKQQPVDLLGMLSLLATSVRAESIGPIPQLESGRTPGSSDTGRSKLADAVAYAIIERVSVHLVDTPRWASRGSARQCEVRLAVLRTLGGFARSPFGTIQLAAHESAIPRLVTVLCGAVDALYDKDVPEELSGVIPDHDMKEMPVDVDAMDIEAGEDAPAVPKLVPARAATAAAREQLAVEKDEATTAPAISDPFASAGDEVAPPPEPSLPEPATPAMLHRIIAQTMRLLHFLITDDRTAALANVQAKLAATTAGTGPGGAQRYLLTLARLNFAEEDLVLEAGVDVETVEMAHELLELAVTPDEGEGVGEVFGH